MKNFDTFKQYDAVIEECKSIFLNKMRDYGTAWRILRTTSLTDQIYIKANRIRSIQMQGTQKVDEGIRPEFVGIVNYAVMALIQLELGTKEEPAMPADKTEKLYMRYFLAAKALMEDKNHDYGEAWRQMRISSLDDIILMKLLRIKQIEDNDGKTIASEGLDANYFDIINYAVFALIRLSEIETQKL
ncbi:MAG: DUF1599 domain-containing protein [Bacteroidales bacterium]|jgi:hypothetical protein|nr:DUF1599 domain-containing protein [Bacteroidales bacterium]